MIKQLWKYKWYILIIMVLIIIEPSVNAMLNFWLQRLFDSATPGVNRIDIMRLLTIGFLLWMLKRVITFASGVLKAQFICNARRDIKHNLFVRLLGLNIANVSEMASSGEYISLFTNDITILETRFYNQLIGMASGVSSVLILGSSFWVLNRKLACAIICFGCFSMFVPAIFSKKLNFKNLEYSNVISKFTQGIKEYMVAYPTIKNYSAEKAIIKKFNMKNQETERTKFEADYILSLANSIGCLVSWFMQFIAVGLGLMLVAEGEILVGTVVAAQSFASDLAMPLQEIITNVNSIQSVKEIVTKFDKLTTLREEDTALVSCYSSNEGENTYDIVFDNVLLKIGDKKVIDHFSFNFESGKKYLIVGVNGSGKSSLFKTLKKWYKNCSGNICVNGKDISLLNNDDISKNISYLNEEVMLFSGSVKENIELFKEYSPNDLNKVISVAQIKLQLEREINDEGRNISSGEQRRIEIARSLLKSVNVLIFDEVVSTLDIETAYEIERLALGFEGKTVIFVSHNFSGKLMREYDDILVMENGKLLAHGCYEDLIQKCDYFRKICDIKFGKLEEL